ncbi:DUF262 domain-containing protein [Phycisphaerales bacterium AB-hyl4]|uniref:DUF262 domain-containing protein n=1 Tax=Natronomicrosphaera hydrolytica TaxID=3242702 RepID=A0ABV4UA75_9BACT
MPGKDIDFDKWGIGETIERNYLRVPVNQRSYAWHRENVDDLYADLRNAMNHGDPEYFLGTMVFIRCDDGTLEVADGQQRLATTIILYAALRDYLADDPSQRRLYESISQQFLSAYDMHSDSDRAKLKLNTSDDDYFYRRVILPPDHTDRMEKCESRKPSHLRIEEAAKFAARWVSQKITDETKPDRQIENIRSWITYLTKSAQVIVVIVPDAAKAFSIFETLNDRGLKLSQLDLLKNYLYATAAQKDRLDDIRSRWDEMVGTLEANGLEERSLDYVRQLWISFHGHVKADDIFSRIRNWAKTPGKVVEFGDMVSQNSAPYAAIINPSHPLWSKNQHTHATRDCIRILGESLRVDRIRPLLLSTLMTFDRKATEQTFRLCVAWTVRFLIVGGIGSGTIEQFYANAAQEIRSKKITTPKQLADQMKRHVPADREFEDQFARVTVSRNYTARYYLWALELATRGDKDPMLVNADDPDRFDLEHVMPQKPSGQWSISEEDHSQLVKRIGNLTILEKKINSDLKSDDFDVKQPAYAKSSIHLTRGLSDMTGWSKHEITARQTKLAALAPKIWTLNVRA